MQQDEDEKREREREREKERAESANLNTTIQTQQARSYEVTGRSRHKQAHTCETQNHSDKIFILEETKF